MRVLDEGVDRVEVPGVECFWCIQRVEEARRVFIDQCVPELRVRRVSSFYRGARHQAADVDGGKPFQSFGLARAQRALAASRELRGG